MEVKLDKQLFEDEKLYSERRESYIKKNEKTAAKVADSRKMQEFVKDYTSKVKELYNGLNSKEFESNPMAILATLEFYDSLRGELKAQEKTFMGYRSFWQKLTGDRGEYGKLEAMLKPAGKAISGYMAEHMEEFRSYFSALNKKAQGYADKYMGAREGYLEKKLLEVQAAQKKAKK